MLAELKGVMWTRNSCAWLNPHVLCMQAEDYGKGDTLTEVTGPSWNLTKGTQGGSEWSSEDAKTERCRATPKLGPPGHRLLLPGSLRQGLWMQGHRPTAHGHLGPQAWLGRDFPARGWSCTRTPAPTVESSALTRVSAVSWLEWQRHTRQVCPNYQIIHLKSVCVDFPGGPVVNNLPANSGDWGLTTLAREDSTWLGATRPTYHNYWGRCIRT